MQKEREEYLACIANNHGDAAGQKEALSYVARSDAYAYGKPVPFSFVPYFINNEDMAFFERINDMISHILSKVIRRFLSDPKYRALFAFPPEIERLILLPCNYEQLICIGRFDLFLDEKTRVFKFCEFNTDGAGAMSRSHVIASALEQTKSWQDFSRAHHQKVREFELFDSWVQSFLRIYASDTHARANPSVAICDFKESGVFSDFRRFIAAFERAKIRARFVDVRSLVFDGKHLIDPSDGEVIDAVYRRAVTSELACHLDECQALIDAVAAQKVCLIGHFRTTIAHSKMVNVALFDEATRGEIFTQKELAFIDEHVPRTYRLCASLGTDKIAEIKANKDAWIIKPADDYGGHGVYPGVDFDSLKWAQIIDKHLDTNFIVQEFYQPPCVDIVLPCAQAQKTDAPYHVERWQSMPGFYVYDAKIAGFYNRLGQHGVIALGDGGGICATAFRVGA